MRKKTKEILRIIEGPQPPKEIPVHQESLYMGRPDPTMNWEPDIDLSPDYQVSRKHCRLFFRDGAWWIEDVGSQHGTLVDEKEIKGVTEPTRLSPGVPVKMGNTVWQMTPPDLILRTWKGMTIEFRPVSAINYALYHCGVPIISDFAITNHTSAPSPPVTITVSIAGWSRTWRKALAPLPPGHQITIPKIHLELRYEKLEGHEGKKRARLEMKADGETIFDQPIHILGFYEWPFDPAFRKSLACFVQPAHPMIQHVVAEATLQLKRQGIASSFTQLFRAKTEYKVDHALKAFYDCLAKRYTLRYALPEGREPDSQELRPPHRVIFDPTGGNGHGSCIDLALLLASCLEGIHLQPLIFLVREEGETDQHAFLGCWRDIAERFEPIVIDYQQLKRYVAEGRLLLLETTSLTQNFKEAFKDSAPDIREIIERCSSRQPMYEEAKALAEAQFTPEKFILALDVAAARQTVPPLQFPLNPGVIGIIRKAEEMALKEGENHRLETRHLFYGFLLKGTQAIQDILRKAKADLSRVDGVLSRAEREEEVSIRPTINYRRVIEDARIIAGDCGVVFVDEEHLFYALLLSQSESVNQILAALGTNCAKVKDAFEARYQWVEDIVQTFYESR